MPQKKLTADNRCERVLKAARMELGLTQCALAKRMKVSQGTVCSWEKNIGSISVDKLVFYCKILKVDANEILAIKSEELTRR